MIRCWVESDQIQGDRVHLDPSQTKHLVTVLRLQSGDELIVMASSGNWEARLELLKGRRCQARLLKPISSAPDEPWQITLAVAVPHRTVSFEQILDQATELGVSAIVPMLTERSVARPEKASSSGRAQRWQKIVISATQQCGRAKPPEVSPVLSLEETLSRFGASANILIPTLGVFQRRGISEIVAESDSHRPWLIFIGPEGDFSPQEIQAVLQAGGHPISLSPLTFRVETAATAAVAMLLEALRGKSL